MLDIAWLIIHGDVRQSFRNLTPDYAGSLSNQSDRWVWEWLVGDCPCSLKHKKQRCLRENRNSWGVAMRHYALKNMIVKLSISKTLPNMDVKQLWSHQPATHQKPRISCAHVVLVWAPLNGIGDQLLHTQSCMKCLGKGAECCTASMSHWVRSDLVLAWSHLVTSS